MELVNQCETGELEGFDVLKRTNGGGYSVGFESLTLRNDSEGG